MDLTPFAEAVGPAGAGPVTCVGGRTQWSVGGAVDRAAREVRAPAGVVDFVPAEMVVRCGAGTALVDLQTEVGRARMHVALEGPPGATVGGVLAVGRAGLRTLGWGPPRDVLLEARFVDAGGRVVKAGGPVVKNVSGYDLCRLLVGSLGTLGFLGEVVLRCRPLPAVSLWLRSAGADPFAVLDRLHRPAAVLWDGTTTWVCLEGHGEDVDAQRRALGGSFAETDGPPAAPDGARRSMRPGDLRTLSGTFLAQVGVGVVHTAGPAPPSSTVTAVVELNRRVKDRFDPTGRLNPGRMVP